MGKKNHLQCLWKKTSPCGSFVVFEVFRISPKSVVNALRGKIP